MISDIRIAHSDIIESEDDDGWIQKTFEIQQIRKYCEICNKNFAAAALVYTVEQLE
jgi:hypothetical protein